MLIYIICAGRDFSYSTEVANFSECPARGPKIVTRQGTMPDLIF